ncbi:uncharacterized protein LOC122529218 [Frieseomelitta varia]|uniref:uncharacterized protein LOC122529218 n=1 Tax=Frieseomelitta varia TaxID=561572 RepID=UPI001CB6B228|nr:uncharacterized protein LOC122529218 [Frieseomelitta varia]XP_043511013.1 uncharacterized protein LOC122529218 [Frieseomelitta varia]
MLATVADILFLYLVTLACMTSGILTTEVPRNIQPVTNLQPPSLSYLPTVNTVFPKLSQHAVFTDQALDNGLEDVRASGRSSAERQIQSGYSYLKPLLIHLKLPFKDQTIKSISSDKQRSSNEEESSGTKATTRASKSSGPSNRTTLQSVVGYHPHVPRRSAYQVVEELDEYLTDNSDHAGLPYRGKAQATNPHRDSQDITTAIKALDHFLSGVLNDDSYNSELHPPPNPVLALVLSRYGRYVPRARNPRVYAHMAVNNIHNNKPFGSYKLECEELPTYAR